MLAMDVNDNAGCLIACVVWAFFASMLAPTVDRCFDGLKEAPHLRGFLFDYAAVFFALIFFNSSSRSSRRRILPTLVVGSASRNSTAFGTL